MKRAEDAERSWFVSGAASGMFAFAVLHIGHAATILAALRSREQEVAAAVAAENEACAKVADEFDASGADGYNIPTWGEGVAEGAAHAANGITAAIRARRKGGNDA